MVHQLAADQTTEATVLTDRPQGRSALVFLVGLAVAGILTASATVALLLGEGLTGGASATVRGLLIASLVISAALAGISNIFYVVAIQHLIGAFGSGARRTRNYGLFSISVSVSSLIGPTVAGFAIDGLGHKTTFLLIAGFPAAFVGILFSSSLLVEVIFSLDGLGLLGFEAAINRDYPVMFATLYVFTLLGLVMKLVSDLTYVLIDPRIDFESRRV